MGRPLRRAPSVLNYPRKSRTLELFIISAQDLRNVSAHDSSTGKIKTYAVAYIDPKHKMRTHWNDEGGSDPSWNQKLSFSIDESLFEDVHAQLTIEIYKPGTWKEKLLLGKDKLVGTARILIPDAVKIRRSPNIFPVTSILIFHNSQPQGVLNICVPAMGRFPDQLDFSQSMQRG